MSGFRFLQRRPVGEVGGDGSKFDGQAEGFERLVVEGRGICVFAGEGDDDRAADGGGEQQRAAARRGVMRLRPSK